MAEKKVLPRLAKDCANTAITTIYFTFAYFVSCLLLNNIIPRFIATERTAQQFFPFGAAAIIICSAGFALLKAAWGQPSSLALIRALKALGIMCEALIFIGAIAIFIEGIQYATWVGQFGPITAHSGVDARFWVAGILLTDGILGNLLAALLLA